MQFSELTNDQARHLVDIRQVFEEWEFCRGQLAHSFSGSMRWVERKGYVYLLKKEGRREQSLGRRSETTKKTYHAFMKGREESQARLGALDERLGELAPVSKALRLNRVPITTARVLRHLREAGLLGNTLTVAGTTCLFLYESMAAVFFEGGLLATGDVDLLWDSRQTLALAGPGERDEAFLGLLRKADRSFRRTGGRAFRAVNRGGFMVDLIRPIDPIPNLEDGGIEGAEIVGLDWLVNAPKIDGIAIAQDGKPVRLWCPDPRVFALHKLWLSELSSREPLKRRRDALQAQTVAAAAERFGLDFRGQDLSSLPEELRVGISRLKLKTEGTRP